MSDKNAHSHYVPWTFGNSADPKENIAISLAWIVGPSVICAFIGYLFWT